ncbi:MAG: hypothetical protein CL840_03975 [Crocinitomicaceae bacterium]|nr:hypothetical protein [Crocinitomicaceae bacterium]|tara:strand:+ start:30 stop:809 length:780 start_codon:yes stop_codon:yes gene_type:complete
MNGEQGPQTSEACYNDLALQQSHLIFNTWSNTMKRILIKLATALSLTMIVATAHAKTDSQNGPSQYLTPFSEGTHYTTLKEQFPEETTVREVFSVYCPHCFKLEPIIQTIKPGLNDYVKVKRHHVDFLRSAKKEEQVDVTKAILLAERHGVSEDLIGFTFTAIHQHRQLPERAGLENLLVTLGVPETEVKSIWENKDVASEQEKLASMQDAWAKSGDIKGVPTLIVNGKYRVELSGIKANTGEEFMSQLTELINYLTLL